MIINKKNKKMRLQKFILLTVLMLASIFSMAQSLSTDIRLNQLGFLPNAQKLAAVVNAQVDSFKVMTTDLSTIVFDGQMLPPVYYSSSGEDVRLADFTLVTTPGHYVLVVDELGKSFPFEIGSHVFSDISKSTLKSYYFNRASTPILSEFAGVYARDAGHPDTAVVVLPSAASANRPAGTKISTPGGWYDAGDYNKYIVSSGISVFTLLSAYETYPSYYDTLAINIPESNNNIPDILDEALWNIRWMMTMQDEDGGVYNKTTDANFGPSWMPSAFNETRYVTAKTTAATLDFGAIMAMTARIYRPYNAELADSALHMAKLAWKWAKDNPKIPFFNPSAQGGFPAINTGGYGDSTFDDEFTWCAAELYITTGESEYYNAISFDVAFGVPGWPVVGTLALLSLIVNQDALTPVADIEMIKSKFLNTVSGPRNNAVNSPYRIPGDFYYWAGNNAFANWGMCFMQAFRLTGDASYFNAAVATLDYLLGKNATTYSFVTGEGSKTPMHIHHRISTADGITDPVPGLLVCGANPSDMYDCGANRYPSTFPAKAYLDAECSFSTNEIAIGINAPLVFLTGAIQMEYLQNFLDSMPLYFSVSRNRINLPSGTGHEFQLMLQGNTHWELVTQNDWISISALSGSGNATVQISSKTENNDESDRTGLIFVYSQDVLTDSVFVIQTGKRRSFRIEAEDYQGNFATQNEATADIGGGLNVGYIDVGSWLTYKLDIAFEGYYDIIFRHAGWEGNFDVFINDEFIKNVRLPKTADWQVWQSHIVEMEFEEGLHVMKMLFKSPGTNLNWYQFDWKDKTDVASLYPTRLKIYPNPTNQYVNIDLGNNSVLVNIQLLSIDGRVILNKEKIGQAIETIDVSTLQKGTYLVKVSNSSQTTTRLLIIN
jgi:endoglucanase